MFRALYPYESNHRRILSFKPNEFFVLLDPGATDEEKSGWVEVINCEGYIGFVPLTYVESVQRRLTEMVTVIQAGVQKINVRATNTGQGYTKKDLQHLQKLEALSKALCQEIQQNATQINQTLHQKLLEAGIPIDPAKLPAAQAIKQHQQQLAALQEVDELPDTPPGDGRTPSTSLYASVGQIPQHSPGGIGGKPAPAVPPKPARPLSGGDGITQPVIPPHLAGSHDALNMVEVGSATEESLLEELQKDLYKDFDDRRNPDGGSVSRLSICKEQTTSTTQTARRRSSSIDWAMSESDAAGLVEAVRVSTGLSHNLSKVAIATVMDYTATKMVGIPGVARAVANEIFSRVTSLSAIERELATSSRDECRLLEIFKELRTYTEDEQERNWALHGDERVLLCRLDELVTILENADPSITQKVISKHNFEDLDVLVNFYRMESRGAVRLSLLKSFGVVCEMGRTNITHLLNNTGLLTDLARDIVNFSVEIKLGFERLKYSVLLLTMLLSTGETLPLQHYEHLNEDFCMFLLALMDSPPDEDVDDRIPDLLVAAVLSFNLHFDRAELSNNLVTRALRLKGTAKVFSEKVLMLLNREEDPVRIFDHVNAPPHSVFKLLKDVLADRDTAGFFYTNDLKVLIEIVARRLADLSPEDKIQLDYLTLAWLIIQNTDYGDHLHCQEQLNRCFVRIVEEETTTKNAPSKEIVREIFFDFPQYFQP